MPKLEGDGLNTAYCIQNADTRTHAVIKTAALEHEVGSTDMPLAHASLPAVSTSPGRLRLA